VRLEQAVRKRNHNVAQTHKWLPAANYIKSPVDSTPRSPPTRASRYPIIKIH
jgi:hypothetical protein